MMKPARAATRRLPSYDPLAPSLPAPPPAELFAEQDQVTHDKYGLGRVVSVEDDATLIIDFAGRLVRITMPCAKLRPSSGQAGVRRAGCPTALPDIKGPGHQGAG